MEYTAVWTVEHNLLQYQAAKLDCIEQRYRQEQTDDLCHPVNRPVTVHSPSYA